MGDSIRLNCDECAGIFGTERLRDTISVSACGSSVCTGVLSGIEFACECAVRMAPGTRLSATRARRKGPMMCTEWIYEIVENRLPVPAPTYFRPLNPLASFPQMVPLMPMET